MKKQQPLFVLLVILLFSSILASSGCSDFTAVVRKVTYPPDFNYVSGQEFRSRMNRLAFELQQLDHMLAENNTEQSTQQQRVLHTLLNIERIGTKLQAGEAGSNHPFLQNFMIDFVSNVEQARDAASLNPPSYYFAGLVAGGCVNCHKVNR